MIIGNRINFNPYKINYLSFQAENSSKSFDKVPLNKEPVPKDLQDLFCAIPKTDIHLHLSGSAPLPILKDIMKKDGLSPKEIKEKTTIPDDYKNLDDFLKVYYNIAWCLRTPKEFKRASYQLCKDAAKENIKYLEIRTSVLDKKGTPDEILQAVTDGIKKAKNELAEKGFKQTGKIIVLAQRHQSPEKSLEHAKIAAEWTKKPNSLVVGFDLAGSENQFPSTIHEKAIRYAKENGLKVTIHAGEETVSGPFNAVESMTNALDSGADRLGHAIHVLENPVLLKRVVDGQIPVESTPICHYELNNVSNMKHHPIKRKLDAGVIVSVSTDNRTLSKTNCTREFTELYRNNVITGWDDIKKLVINGAKSAFLPKAEKQQLIDEYNAELKTIEETPKYKEAIDKHLTPLKESISFAGRQIRSFFKQNAA